MAKTGSESNRTGHIGNVNMITASEEGTKGKNQNQGDWNKLIPEKNAEFCRDCNRRKKPHYCRIKPIQAIPASRRSLPCRLFLMAQSKDRAYLHDWCTP
jgi:hypothetical protein